MVDICECVRFLSSSFSPSTRTLRGRKDIHQSRQWVPPMAATPSAETVTPTNDCHAISRDSDSRQWLPHHYPGQWLPPMAVTPSAKTVTPTSGCHTIGRDNDSHQWLSRHQPREWLLPMVVTPSAETVTPTNGCHTISQGSHSHQWLSRHQSRQWLPPTAVTPSAETATPTNGCHAISQDSDSHPNDCNAASQTHTDGYKTTKWNYKMKNKSWKNAGTIWPWCPATWRLGWCIVSRDFCLETTATVH